MDCKFLGVVGETRKSKRTGADYQYEALVVFAEGVGKLEFSLSGLAMKPEVFASAGQLKLEQPIVVHCYVDSGLYASPRLVAYDYDLG